MRLLTRLSLLIPATILAVGGVAFGSGFSIFEQGAKATGMGGAFVATADDPSAIFYNVAGIAQLRRMEVSAGGTIINFANGDSIKLLGVTPLQLIATASGFIHV